jgi:hypothetical protein
VKIGAPGDESDLGAGSGGDVIALGEPSQQLHERAEGGRRRAGSVEVADQADQLSESLVAPGGVTGDRAVDAPRPAFPDPTVDVDQEVVGDVGPAPGGPGVEVIEAAQDCRDI